MLWELQELALPPGDQSGGGLEQFREQDDLIRWRGMGFGGTRVSVGSLGGCLLEPDLDAGFMSRVDKHVVCPSSSSSSTSSPSSWVYLKEYLGWVQDASPRPNWILTEDTTLEGERSEEGREEDLCMGKRRLPCPLPRVWGLSLGLRSTCSPALLRWLCLARFRAQRTGEDGAGRQERPERSMDACSSWALSSASTPSVCGSVSMAVSVWF